MDGRLKRSGYFSAFTYLLFVDGCGGGCEKRAIASPRKRQNKPRKANYEQLSRIVKKNPHLLQREIAKMVGMSKSGVGYALRNLGII